MEFDKWEHCIKCKKTYDQQEYDMQYCSACNLKSRFEMTNQPETTTEYQDALDEMLFISGVSSVAFDTIRRALQFQIDHREEIEAGNLSVPATPNSDMVLAGFLALDCSKMSADERKQNIIDIWANMVKVSQYAASQNAGEGET